MGFLTNLLGGKKALVEGRVFRSDTNQPIANATVLLLSSTLPLGHPSCKVAETKTDDQGNYVLPNLKSGTYLLTFHAQFDNTDELPFDWREFVSTASKHVYTFDKKWFLSISKQGSTGGVIISGMEHEMREDAPNFNILKITAGEVLRKDIDIRCNKAPISQPSDDVQPRKEPPALQPSADVQAPATEGRAGDETVLGNLILGHAYHSQAGSVGVGYFNPDIAPFRQFPKGQLGLMASPTADAVLLVCRQGAIDVDEQEISVRLAVRLGLSSVRDVTSVFERVVKIEEVSKFLSATTTMPFFLQFTQPLLGSKQKALVIAEVDYELKLNALANLLLADHSFAAVTSAEAFVAQATALPIEREKEYQEAIELVSTQLGERFL